MEREKLTDRSAYGCQHVIQGRCRVPLRRQCSVAKGFSTGVAVKPKYRPSPSQIFPKFPVQLFAVTHRPVIALRECSCTVQQRCWSSLSTLQQVSRMLGSAWCKCTLVAVLRASSTKPTLQVSVPELSVRIHLGYH